jgi:hypothetical protein
VNSTALRRHALVSSLLKGINVLERKINILGQSESNVPHGAVIRTLLSHAIEQPDAKDTAEGIYKFWFPKDSPIPSRKELEEALQFLVVNKRWFVIWKTSPVYSLNKDCFEEVKAFLNQSL